jgi:hypothetical protein
MPSLARLAVVAFAFVVGMGVWGCGSSRRPPHEAAAKQAASAYLAAWTRAHYEQMCTHVDGCPPRRISWVFTMQSFPVPVRRPKVISAKEESDGVIVRYSLEMPDLGSLICAAAGPSPQRAARLLDITGRYVSWDDSLRMVRSESTYVVGSKRGTDVLARFVLGIGAYVRVGPEKLRFGERLTILKSVYLVQSDLSAESPKAGKALHDAASQCIAYIQRLGN